METTIKEEALRAIAELPDTASMNEIMYRLYVIDSVLQGKKSAEAGSVTSSKDILSEIEQW
ncbi:MAG: hypothetical protein IPM69_08810 [Ignavibacteria bacterium]|nr:hypothetical protein [Ignavibacteria bacterium]